MFELLQEKEEMISFSKVDGFPFQEFIASEIYMAWLLLIVTEIPTSEALVLIVFCIQVSFTGS